MTISLNKHLWPYVHKVELRSIGLFITSSGGMLLPTGPVYPLVKNDESVITDEEWDINMRVDMLEAKTRLKIGSSPIITWAVAISAIHTKGGVTMRSPRDIMDFIDPRK